MIVLIFYLGRGGLNRVALITENWTSSGGCLDRALMTLENILFCRKTAFTGSHKIHMPSCECKFMWRASKIEWFQNISRKFGFDTGPTRWPDVDSLWSSLQFMEDTGKKTFSILLKQSFFCFTVYFAPCQNTCMPKMKCNVCYSC